LPLTSALWQWLPKLRFVQFPWRWLLPLNAGGALVCAMSARRWTSRAIVWLGVGAIIAFCCCAIQQPWWESADEIQDMEDAIHKNLGYEGTYEYVPTAADVEMIPRDAPMVGFEGKGKARIDIGQWSSEYRSFVADVSSEGNLVLHLFNYPAWSVVNNGIAVHSETLDPTGQMVIPVRPGRNYVQIAFAGTWDRTAGLAISAAALLTCIALAIL